MATNSMQAVMATAENALGSVVEQSRSDTISLLSAKFGFNEKEAHEFMKQQHPSLSLGLSGKGKGKGKGKSLSATSDCATTVKVARAPTGYMLYSAHVRPSVVNELSSKLADGEKLKGQAVMKGIGAKWQELSDEDKAHWNDKAKSADVAK